MNNPIIAVLLNLLTNPIVVGGIVLLIVFLIKGLKKNNNVQTEDSATKTQAYTSATSSATSYSGTSKIFVNGGKPLSGSKMGTLSVDGKSISLYYTDAPIEITIPTGRHHIVVEGGVAGDARIDRFIEFGVLDVWTVDMPGGNDADVIRHQMISSSEYRRALSDAGFHVTKRHI